MICPSAASELSGAYALGTVLAAGFLPLTGAAMDRFGIRATMTVVVMMVSLACGIISLADNLVFLCFSFFCLRLFAQGSLSLLAANTMAMWFDRRLGTVHGISHVVVTISMGFAPLLFREGIDFMGWRSTYRWLGVAVVCVMLPLLLLYRNRPADVGQMIDGGADAPSGNSTDFPADDLELRDVLRHRSYWILLGIVTVWSMIGTAVIFEVQPLAAAKQADMFSPESACTIMFVGVAAMTLIGGFLSDRLALNRLLSVSILGIVVGLATLLLTTGNYFFVAFGIIGLSQGLLLAVGNTIWVRYFGRRHLGKIRGGSVMTMVAGSSLGPLLLGLGVDLTGSYAATLWFFLLTAILAFVATLFLRPPGKGNQVEATS